MRRTQDEALQDLRAQLQEWLASGARPGVRVFVYPPEWELALLARFPTFVAGCAGICTIDLVDVGQGFVAEVDQHPGLVDRLTEGERDQVEAPLQDLGVLGRRYLQRLLASPAARGAQARLLVNTGALGTFVSYSAIANALYETGSDGRVALPTVLAFPGEADDSALSLLRLRADTNYRVPRV